jgi:hypothetical protein
MPGLDPEAAREQAKRLVLHFANHETLLAGGEGDAQLAMVLLENADLYQYQRCKQIGLAELTAEVSAQLRKAKTEFRLIPSAAPFNVQKTYFEGMSFTGTAGLADTLMPLVYDGGETYPLVLNNIRAFDHETPVGMATTLHPARFSDKGAFINAITDAKQSGCTTFYVYNYSLASAERLGWIVDMNRVLHHAP